MIRRVRRKATQAKERSTATSISGACDPDSAPPPSGNCFAKDASLFAADDDDVVVVVVEPEREVDWTALPDDTVVALFTRLNYRDRASLASVCCTWRRLGASTYLWNALDLRAHTLDGAAAASLAGRCVGLQRLRFRGASAAEVLINLQAKDLRDLRGDACRDLTNAYLSMLAARHGRLETLQLGPDCDHITSEAVKVVALCCPNLRRFRLAGARDVDGDAIRALAKHCPKLSELGLLDCGFFDEAALGFATSLCYLSVAGSRNISWTSAAQHWSKLTNLVALDASRTEISPAAAVQLLTSENLKILCALNCSVLEDGSEAIACSTKGKLVLARFTDIMKALDAVSSNFHPMKLTKKHADKGTMEWLEWALSHALLRIAEKYVPGLDGFWLKQGTALMLKLVRSSQEDVQERAATALGTFIVIDEESAIVDPARAEAVMHSGGIAFLLHLARSCREGVQSEAAKAIANLSVNAEVAKAVAEEGGIIILAALARSPNRSVAEEAAGGLWNLSVGEEHKGAIAEAGGIKALVDLVFKWPVGGVKWPVGGEGVLERAAGALANLAADDKCSMEVAMAGGVHALVMLARFCKNEGVQEQAARALANLAAHGDSNGNNAAVGQEAGALEALVQLTCSQHEGVRQEAAGALWNLSFDDRNREAIANAGGVEALVALAQSCSTGSQGLQERAAGALWGLSVSEANSIAIGREGGIAPLITLAFSESEDVHETAAGALWNLAFNAVNAWRILEGGGVVALVHLCSSGSKMARFMAALTLAYMFDGRMDSYVTQRVHFDGARLLAKRHIEMFVEGFSDQQMLSAAIVSWGPAALTLVADSARIQEAGHLRCSGSEIGRFVQMLKNSCLILRSCAAFALLQFTMPGGRHAIHHATLLHRMGASRVLRAAAASATAPLQAKVFARIVLRNLEHCSVDALLV